MAATSIFNFNGDDGATSFPDKLGVATATPSGNVKISTAKSAFGGASAAFDGASGTRLSISGLPKRSGVFSIRLWVYFNNVNSTQVLYDFRGGGGGGGLLYLNGGTLQYLGQNSAGNGSPAAAGFHDILLTRDATTTNNLRIYLDGTQIINVTDNIVFGSTPRIGDSIDGGAVLNGYIDDLCFFDDVQPSTVPTREAGSGTSNTVNISASGVAEYLGTAVVKRYVGIRPAGQDEFVGQTGLRQYARMSAVAVAEYATAIALKSYRNIKTSGASEITGRVVYGTAAASISTRASAEITGAAALGVQVPTWAAGVAEFLGRTGLLKLTQLRTGAASEFPAYTGLTARYALRTLAGLEYQGRAGSTVQPKLDFNSIYGNPGAPYGYGPYGKSVVGPISTAGLEEFAGLAVLATLVGHQPSDFYAYGEMAGRVRLAVSVPLHLQPASLAYSGRVRGTVQTGLRAYGRIELSARSRHAAVFGGRRTAALSLVARLQMSYAWSDLSYPTRPVVGSWGNVAPAVDPWQTVQTGGDGWHSARPVPEK